MFGVGGDLNLKSPIQQGFINQINWNLLNSAKICNNKRK